MNLETITTLIQNIMNFIEHDGAEKSFYIFQEYPVGPLK